MCVAETTASEAQHLTWGGFDVSYLIKNSQEGRGEVDRRGGPRKGEVEGEGGSTSTISNIEREMDQWGTGRKPGGLTEK